MHSSKTSSTIWNEELLWLLTLNSAKGIKTVTGTWSYDSYTPTNIRLNSNTSATIDTILIKIEHTPEYTSSYLNLPPEDIMKLALETAITAIGKSSIECNN